MLFANCHDCDPRSWDFGIPWWFDIVLPAVFVAIFVGLILLLYFVRRGRWREDEETHLNEQ